MKTPTANYNTHFNLQDETSNNKVYQEVFQELHRKGGTKCKKISVQESAWKFHGLVLRSGMW